MKSGRILKMKNSHPSSSSDVFRLRNSAQFPGRFRPTKKKVGFKYLALIVIICFVLSFLISLLFDGPSSPGKRAITNIQREMVLQEIENLEREGITAGDLERLSREYDRQRNR